MNCSDMLRKIDIKVSALESELNTSRKECESIKRVLATVVQEREKTGVIDVDVIKTLTGK